MPGPRIINKEAEARKAAAVERKAYYLTDPKCKEIMGFTVTDEIRANGIVLTAGEAMALIANGALTTDKAAAEEAAQIMAEQHDALVQRRADEAAALQVQSDAATDAALHNMGEHVSTVAGGDSAAMPEGSGATVVKAGDAPLSPAEVDKAMTAPADGTSPAPIDPAAVQSSGSGSLTGSAETKGDATWAARQQA